MSATVDKYRLLVERLYKRTTARKLIWTYDPFDDDVSTSVSDKKIHLARGENVNDEPIIRLTMRNADHVVLESYDDEDLSGSVPKIPSFSSYFQLMVALRDMAMRQATGADKALDDVLDELSDDGLV